MRAEVHAGDQKEGISLVELGELCVLPGKLSHVSVTSQTNWLLTVPNLKQKKGSILTPLNYIGIQMKQKEQT